MLCVLELWSRFVQISRNCAVECVLTVPVLLVVRICIKQDLILLVKLQRSLGGEVLPTDTTADDLAN